MQHFPALYKRESVEGEETSELVVEREILILVSESSQPLISNVVSKMHQGVNLEQVLENVKSEYNENNYTCAIHYSTMSKNLGVKDHIGDRPTKEESEPSKCVLM